MSVEQSLQSIRCEEGKLLARKNEQGLFLYCKLCHTEHFYTWEALQKPLDKEASEVQQHGL
jgi:hypothetical protein